LAQGYLVFRKGVFKIVKKKATKICYYCVDLLLGERRGAYASSHSWGDRKWNALPMIEEK
jgi:hypothetical protein